MTERLPADLRGPVDLALAKAVDTLPGPEALPGGSRWEPKWDGYRASVVRDADVTTVWSRHGNDLTPYVGDLCAAAAELVPPGCVLDGEVVVWADGRLDFSALQRRLTSSRRNLADLVRREPASFVAFDVLAVAGRDARHLPLRDRRALLEELGRTWRPPLQLSPVTTDPDEARQWFDELHVTGVEGLVIKGAGQRYEGGKRQWRKLKRRDTVDVVLAAVIGPRQRPRELVVGLPLGGELRIVGRTGPRAAYRAAARRVPPRAGRAASVAGGGALVDRGWGNRHEVTLTWSSRSSSRSSPTWPGPARSSATRCGSCGHDLSWRRRTSRPTS